MDQKNQGNQRSGNQQSGQQHTQSNPPTTQNPNREPAEGPRHQQMPGQNDPSHREQTRGNDDNRGNRRQYDEKNQGEGISNRGMQREMEEQSELPSRGSSQFDESESDSER
jgi:hypothetical protein